MKRLIYILMFMMLVIACEEIYHPKLEDVDDLLVVEGILITDQQSNSIYLYKTKGFNETNDAYPRVGGATVYLIDDENKRIDCKEYNEGVYLLTETLDPNRSYRLNIELDGEIYISEMQSVPETPHLDTVYGQREYDVSVDGTANSGDKIEKEYGIRLYTDIKYTEGTSHYRFSGRKVIQYTDYYDTVINGMPVQPRIYIWRSIYPSGTFNIGGPPEYSTSKDIKKQPLEFFINNFYKLFPDTMVFEGWIYLIDQYGMNEDTYQYYEKLNAQLGAEGRIFDPLYNQIHGNIKCTTDPTKIVLGNFEISSHAEWRYYIMYDQLHEPFKLKKIPYYYHIPYSGYIKMYMPDFWESMFKNYPNE